MNTIQSVYIERASEESAPPTEVLKLSYSDGGIIPHSGEMLEPVLFLSIGAYDERTFEDDFRSSEAQTFSVNAKDFLRALVGLGALERVVFESDEA